MSFKISLGSKKTTAAHTTEQPPTKRPRLDLGGDEPEDENQHVAIEGWDTTKGGAVDVNKKGEKPLLIIPALANRNWGQEAARKRIAAAAQGAKKEEQGKGKEEQSQEGKVQYGLIIKKKDDNGGTPMDQNEPPQEKPNQNGDKTGTHDGLTEDQRLDKQALEALINGKSSTANLDVIPAQTEAEAFRNDYENAPEAPSLEAYVATPIEGFGAALLRGMGWKDGEELKGDRGQPATKPREIKRRPALLGIGAKEEAAVGVELGAWGKGEKGRKKTDVTYNPVVLKNKITGETLTEEELKAKLEQQKSVEEEQQQQRDSDQSRRREKARDQDRERKGDYDSEYERKRKKRRQERKERDRKERERDRSEDDRSDRRRHKRDRDRDEEQRPEDDDRRVERRRGRDRSYDRSDRRRDRKDRDRSRERDDRKRDSRRDETDRDRDRYRDSDRERWRSRSRDSGKRRRDLEDDERGERKKRHKERGVDEKYRK